LKKFFSLYAGVFALIWLSTGIYALIAAKPAARYTFLFGIGFSIAIFLATRFSYWLFRRYQRIDELAKELTVKK